MNPDSRVIRGVNIATIVLSALGIFGGLALVMLMGVASASLSDPSVVNALVSELQSSGSSSSAFDGASPYSSYDFSGMTQDEAMAVAGTSIVLMVGLSLGYVVCKVVCLVAGILALRNCNNPAKLGGAFGWTIAAAIVSLLVGGMVSLVLFVISAVYINRARKSYAASGYGYQQPPHYQQPGQNDQAPQQPMMQAPQQLQQPNQSQVPPAPQPPTGGEGKGSDSNDQK